MPGGMPAAAGAGSAAPPPPPRPRRMHGVVLDAPDDYAGWRAAARALVVAGIGPGEVVRRSPLDPVPLLDGPPPPEPPPGAAPPRVPRAFPELAEAVIRHRDPERFALLHGLLHRLQSERALLDIATDPEVARANAMAKAVRRDAHKMHAFVRFRERAAAEGPRFVAWYEPDHHILRAEADFFVRRFAAMRWSILTPLLSAHWEGEAGGTVRFGPGARRADAPPEDAAEELWRTYFANIFNPARLKPDAMRAEMPKKFWANLPEARDIPRLMAEAPARVAAMVARGATAPAPRRQRRRDLPPLRDVALPDMTQADPPADPAPSSDAVAALEALRRDLAADDALPAWSRQATRPVFGEGPPGAMLMFIGEQPGDEEDLQGRPFVGPAGRLFNRALAEAGIARDEAYVTNAVKHFKFKPTGRRRLHQTPDNDDIARYQPFLRREIEAVAPRLVVSLGATALRAVTGRTMPVTKLRGSLLRAADGRPFFPTVHPSYLLRLPDEAMKAREYERFLEDLAKAAATARAMPAA